VAKTRFVSAAPADADVDDSTRAFPENHPSRFLTASDQVF
jgi:hypothetical protein